MTNAQALALLAGLLFIGVCLGIGLQDIARAIRTWGEQVDRHE